MDQTYLPTLVPAAPAAASVSPSRLRLLTELQRNRGTGMTVDELSETLSVSHNAVQQHLTALQRDGLVRVSATRATGGRPGRAYAPTEAGLELFPRRYAQLADGLLRHSRQLFGAEGLERLLESLAAEAAEACSRRLEGLSGDARLEAVVGLLNELGYDATLNADGSVTAHNCVFHQLTRSSNEICRYDRALLGAILGGGVDHDSCIADGHACCRFRPA